MKAKLLLMATILGGTITLHAQNIELTPYTGWQWGGKLDLAYGTADFDASQNFGVSLNVIIPNKATLQLEYMRQPTEISYSEYGGSLFQHYNTNIDWYQIGALREFPVNDRISPFVGITLGATNMRVDSESYIDEWAFSVTGQLGAKIYLNDRIGLRLHLRMLTPMQFGGFGLYFGTGGSGAGASVGSYIIQGDVGGGLIIRLGK